MQYGLYGREEGFGCFDLIVVMVARTPLELYEMLNMFFYFNFSEDRHRFGIPVVAGTEDDGEEPISTAKQLPSKPVQNHCYLLHSTQIHYNFIITGIIFDSGRAHLLSNT
jgi:hypothetical protein